MNFLFALVIPVLIIVLFSYWTLKIMYKKRFIPTAVLAVIALSALAGPFIASSIGVMEEGFGAAVSGIYYSLFLAVGMLVTLMIAVFIKKDGN
ncbi:hypothetical protein D3H55_08955 [Bacillus salacetis]|uniref:Uncharacterized protein n=2 Tax=Bacillus salacetis TaxID=2315464 RepID=A0A3A1R5L0_9BACI|nr:hypothetical protein D3H55_08955 [Bacillus salacetis]